MINPWCKVWFEAEGLFLSVDIDRSFCLAPLLTTSLDITFNCNRAKPP